MKNKKSGDLKIYQPNSGLGCSRLFVFSDCIWLVLPDFLLLFALKCWVLVGFHVFVLRCLVFCVLIVQTVLFLLLFQRIELSLLSFQCLVVFLFFFKVVGVLWFFVSKRIEYILSTTSRH